MRFYGRLLNKTPKQVIFEFMEAHQELVQAYQDEPRMIFRKFNEMPVEQFLSRGHCYLMRSSNHWRDMYPRVHGEAICSGLASIIEPRDGTAERLFREVGNVGFFACHFDEFLLHLLTLERKRDLQYEMGRYAKEWGRRNLDPQVIIDKIEELCLNA